MKESFDEFENELRGTIPPKPREELTTRIAGKLDQQGNGIRIYLAMPLAAAALIGILAVWVDFSPGDPPIEQSAVVSRPETSAAVDEFRPVDYAQYLYGAQEEEVVYLDELSPMVPVRLFYLDRTVWENEARQIAFETTVPREEVVLLPLKIY